MRIIGNLFITQFSLFFVTKTPFLTLTMTCILLHYETFQQKVALMGYLCYNYNDRVCASRKGRTVMKKFKTTGLCNPSKNYMVDITERLKQIKVMIDNGDYFTINRARQFGKTTTLAALERYLKDEYNVVRLDFQRIGDAGFKTEEAFVKSFSRAVLQKNSKINIPKSINAKLLDFINRSSGLAILDELFYCLIEWCSCSEKPIVLIIDEVDSASNNQVFLDFLAQLRLQYLDREDDEDNPAFQSVILAGVADIKHIKGNIRNDNDSKVNSPWNISADFKIDMSLSADGIKGMLDEYEADHNTGMNTKLIADSIYEHTSGYPFLVSRICQIIDEQLVPDKFDSLNKAWTKQGFNEAIKILLSEKNSLFQSLTGKLTNYPDLKRSIRSILMEGTTLSYSALQESISQMEMYGFIKNNHNTVAISNRIFEMLLYNLFLSDEEIKSSAMFNEGTLAKNIFVEDGRLNMRLVIEHFIKTYTQIFGSLEDKFKEKDGREQFLLFLKPIINGTGNYYIEAQTRDQTRTDVVVDYLGQQDIIELKIWRGQKYNADGEQQLVGYLDHFGLNIGYMLTFNFNKNKEQGVKLVKIGDKTIYEGTV